MSISDAGQAELDKRYRVWYAKKMAQNAPKATTLPVAAYAGNNGQNDTTNATPPTDEELDVIRQWANRTEAEMWAVMVGACENEHEAKNSLNKSIAKCGGKVTKDTYICIYVDFLRRQQEKLQAVEVQVA